MKKETFKKLEDDLFFQVDSEDAPPEDIVAYNELRSAADLFRMYDKGILKIDPDYQRQIVWKNPEQTRFIDSLMKQLPIPSMCFSLDYKTQTWQVIDGLQRLYTIIKFLKEDDWELSNIADVNKNIRGKSVSYIKNNYKDLYSRVENVTLPVNILRCDLSKEDNAEYIFMIFHRLNTGGIKLNNQEIRNAIYQGSFNNFIKSCDSNPTWKKIFATKDVGDRFKKMELILRFFAFYDNYKSYNGKLSYFLNNYMHENQKVVDFNKKREIFESTIEVIYTKLSSQDSISRVSNIVFDALMFGIAKNITKVKGKNSATLVKCYKKMLNNKAFADENISEGILKKDKVLNRLIAAEKAFSDF